MSTSGGGVATSTAAASAGASNSLPAVNGGLCNHMGGGDLLVVNSGTGGGGIGIGEDAAIIQIMGGSSRDGELANVTETNN